jgi:hypothetical protein
METASDEYSDSTMVTLQNFPEPEFLLLKVMAVVWWSAAGVPHYNLLIREDTITGRELLPRNLT